MRVYNVKLYYSVFYKKKAFHYTTDGLSMLSTDVNCGSPNPFIMLSNVSVEGDCGISH